MLEVEPAQYFKVAEQILQIVLDLSVVPSLAWKTIVFPHSRSKDAGRFTIAWSWFALFGNSQGVVEG